MERLPYELHRLIQSYLPIREALSYGRVIRGMVPLSQYDLRKRYENINLNELISKGDIEGIRFLLQTQKPTRNQLSLAAQFGNMKVVELLVNAGSFSDMDLSGALMRAIYENNLKVIRYLLNAGAKADYRESFPLAVAIRSGNIDMISSLIEAGADVEVCDNYPIKYAAALNDLKMVNYLLSKGASPKQPLLIAASRGYDELFFSLIKLVDTLPESLLINAAESDNLTIVKYLFEKQPYNLNPAVIAAAGSDRLEILNYLLQYNPDTATLKSALLQARRKRNYDIISVLKNELWKRYLQERKVNSGENDLI